MKEVKLNEILNQIDEETMNELNKAQLEIDENFNEVAKKRAGIMKKIYYAMFAKLLSNLKIEITAYWKDKVIFNYVIPKD